MTAPEISRTMISTPGPAHSYQRGSGQVDIDPTSARIEALINAMTPEDTMTVAGLISDHPNPDEARRLNHLWAEKAYQQAVLPQAPSTREKHHGRDS